MSGQKIQVDELRHLVGGEWVFGNGARAHSTNPARPKQTVASYRVADEAMVADSVGLSAGAQQSWVDLGLIARGRILRNAATLLEERSHAIAALMTAEEGKTLPESLGEVGAAVETLHYHAAQARSATGSTFASSNSDEWIRTIRVPLGVVGVITPWNFPVQIPVWKIAPALLWGNVVQWKPASETPAVSVAVAEVFHDAGVPAGVLSLLLAPGAVAAGLVADDRVAAITFTGSVPVGRSIAATAVARGAKVQLELGGHNAALVLADACPQAIADVLAFGAMGSTGQKCTATRRIIAIESIYEQVVDAVSESVERLTIGDGAKDGVDIGPMVAAGARAEVEAGLDLALSQGATIAAQASPVDGDGHFFAPTVLTGDAALSICSEEVFGPITTILAVEDLDHAIELANSTSFGLTASVFSGDEVSIRRCVIELDAGLVKANGPTTGSELHVPFGGLKASTFPGPREQNSDSAADFFTSTKSAYLRTPSWGSA